MEAKILRTIVVDDHALIRKNIVLLLERTGHVTVVGQADNGQAALALIKELQPDLAVVDVLMPHMDGFALLRQLKQQSLRLRVLLISVFAHDVFRQQGQLAGAVGFIPKQQLSRLLSQAINAILNDRPFFYPPATIESPALKLLAQAHNYSENDE